MSQVELEEVDQANAAAEAEASEPMNPEDFTDRLDHMVPDQPY
jgi:hypothetical protein